MSLESEIHKKTGVMIRGIPADGKLREFKSGFKKWFALSFGDCAVFGCDALGERYIWNGGKVMAVSIPSKPKRLSRQQIEQERQIVAVGNSLSDTGEAMSSEEEARYILALSRVIEANARQ